MVHISLHRSTGNSQSPTADLFQPNPAINDGAVEHHGRFDEGQGSHPHEHEGHFDEGLGMHPEEHHGRFDEGQGSQPHQHAGHFNDGERTP